MSARKYHNFLSYAYSIYMYNPSLLNLIYEFNNQINTNLDTPIDNIKNNRRE